VVVGTTGWYDDLPAITKEVQAAGGALLWAPNFSVGVHVFAQIVALAAKLSVNLPGFERTMLETHHSAKKDAPSGTALMLARAAEESGGGTMPITSVRVGSVPGTHELVIDGAFEQIRLVHEARDRRVFADGALVAARWLAGRRGVFTMRDVLSGNSET
jgi:4-hydroxy-tetrahydrodipicolinate reductase